MANYIIQVMAFQLIFLMIYDVFLKKETFFNWNRFYLLAATILSIIIPFIRLELFKNTIPQQYIINLPEVIIGQLTPNNQNTIALDPVIIESKSFLTLDNLFYLGVSVATLFFVFKTMKLIGLLWKSPKMKSGKLVIVSLLNSNTAFSFFHFIFLGDQLTESERGTIFKHEMVHVKEKHTLDLLFFEVLRILFWFNPLVYLFQNRIMALHEFIADQGAVKYYDKTHYYQNLLSQVFQTKNISFINPFFKQSLIKKRIVMLQKSKSKQIKLFKYVLLIPMVIGMLVYSSCSGKKNEEISPTLIKKNESIQDLVAELKIKINEKEELSADDRLALLEITLMFSKMNSTSPKWETEFLWRNKDNQTRINEAGEFEIPFSVIEQPPVFSECGELELTYQKKCMAKKISEFVNENFNTKIGADNNLKGRQRISVIFKIDKEGNVTDVKSKAPHPALEAEAIRVVNLLPKMIPGKQDGKNVIVPYSLPIIFEVSE